MIGFIIGFILGGFFGFTIAAIMVVCSDADEREKKFYDRKAVQKGDELR